MSESISDCIHDSIWIRIYDSVYHCVYDSFDVEVPVPVTNTIEPNVLDPIEKHIGELIEKMNDECICTI